MQTQNIFVKPRATGDILLAVLPTVFLPFVVMVIFIINEESGVLEGMAGIVGLVLGIVFGVAYGVTAFVLSQLTRRGKTFRLSLGICLGVLLVVLVLMSGG